ncbi:unnamed protein product [Nezara viridula]|uniref:Uncharacterized protein n=1 Tax=Nezara viridula TaxID=85310 RepID=A0A9P0EFD3_NEZVI|nr:unnamed protein product [Nezara viridula]
MVFIERFCLRLSKFLQLKKNLIATISKEAQEVIERVESGHHCK